MNKEEQNALKELAVTTLNIWIEKNEELFSDMYEEDVVSECGFGYMEDEDTIYYVNGDCMCDTHLTPLEILDKIAQNGGMSEKLYYEFQKED